MTEVSDGEIQTTTLDHLGLVAALCQDLKIAERIDHRLPCHPQRKVSPGNAVVAMILNGLGFTNRRLYLTHQFFTSKAIERILSPNFQAEDITDHTLGHALDDIAEYGASKLFAEIAFGVAVENNLLGDKNHIDTTTMSVHGEYAVNDDPQLIEVTHGFSKDHRRDLKQVILSLVVNGPSAMPIWMDPLDGNSSDKVSFHETIQRAENFRKQINVEEKSKWIADSALYTKDRLLKTNEYTWLTRVPETIQEAKKVVEMNDKDISWEDRGDGYKSASYESCYGEIRQRWLLVFSEQAFKREKKTLEKKLEKEEDELKKALWHLGNQKFHCEKDAYKAFKKAEKKYKFHRLQEKIVVVSKHKSWNRPKKGAEKIIVGYKVEVEFEKDQKKIDRDLNKKGRFILATNDLDKENYKDVKMLEEYKEQQKVENGFRFLKDPWFMVDSIFLKSPKRITALMMVMTLCLMIYNIGQYKLREALKSQDLTLPNQLGKEIKNPTLKWVFQMMEGIGVVYFYNNSVSHTVREVITNLNNLRRKIILLFGTTAAWIYGLYYVKKSAGGLGM